MIIFIPKILVAYECTQTDYRVSYTLTHIYIGHRTPPTTAKMGNKKNKKNTRGAKKTKKVKTTPVQRPRPRTPDQVAALKELGLADAYTFKFETDNDLDSEERLDEDGTVLVRCARDRPYQQGKVLETEYDEGTYWVKLLCTAEQEEYNTNLSDPDIVPLLPRAS